MRRLRALGALAMVSTLLAPAAGAAVKAPRGKRAQDRTGQVIYQDAELTDLTRTKILKVTVTQELPDALVVDVEYNRANEFGDDELGLDVLPDMSLWSVEQVFLIRGRNVVSQQISLQDEAKEPQESRNLAINIEHYRDRHTLGNVFHRIVPFAKTWTPRRRAAGA